MFLKYILIKILLRISNKYKDGTDQESIVWRPGVFTWTSQYIGQNVSTTMYVGTYSPMARIFYESEEGLSNTLYIPSDDSFSDRCQILFLKSTN